MASEQGGKDITVIAGGNLSAGQYRFVTMDSDGKVDLTASAGGTAIGILQNDPAAEGRAAVVRVSGTSKLVSAATITPDDKLQSDANGDALVATNSDHVLAHALENADDNDVFEVLLVSNHILA